MKQLKLLSLLGSGTAVILCVAQCEHLHLDWIRLPFGQMSRSGIGASVSVAFCFFRGSYFFFDKPKKSKLAATRDSADIDESGGGGRSVGGGGIKQNPWQKLLFVLRFALRSLQILIKCIIRIYYSNVC